MEKIESNLAISCEQRRSWQSGVWKKLCKEGFRISGEDTRKQIKKLGLVVKQRVAYEGTTKRNYGDQVADNLLNKNFNPVAANEVWAGDITYLKTAEGWIYLAIVRDLFSRRIVG